MAGKIQEQAGQVQEGKKHMSLLTEAMEPCVMLNKQVSSDGYGGYDYTWTQGAEFQAAIVFDSSIEARTAEKAGVTSLYTVTVEKGLMLEYHDIFKRLRDGKIFRVTSDGDDKFTPVNAGIDMRQVTAEEYSLPNG